MSLLTPEAPDAALTAFIIPPTNPPLTENCPLIIIQPEINRDFHPREAVDRSRDPQLRAGENCIFRARPLKGE